jgi:hypothetical protein
MSWLATPDGMQARFNRDESTARAAARAPALHRGHTAPFIAPIDPEGGGTWITLSADGCVHALLNRYDIPHPPVPRPLSRGVVPWNLSCGQWHIADLLVDPSPLKNFGPFDLVKIATGEATRYSWNGSDFRGQAMDSTADCLSSSSLDPERVTGRRLAAFRRLFLSAPLDPAQLHSFHDGYETAGDPASSVLMDRPGRRTISQSRIHIGRQHVAFEERIRDPDGDGFLKHSHRITMSRRSGA